MLVSSVVFYALLLSRITRESFDSLGFASLVICVLQMYILADTCCQEENDRHCMLQRGATARRQQVLRMHPVTGIAYESGDNV
jgi:hypothetical protein